MNFDELRDTYLANQRRNKELYKESSREKLKKETVTRMRTIMIGSLDALEQNLGFLWEDGKYDSRYMEIYQKIRKQILDNGNYQIREFESGLFDYNIELKRQMTELPIVKGKR